MKKILIVVDHFAPYRDNTFKKLEENYDLKFLITGGNTSHPEWSYNSPEFSFVETSKRKSYGKFGYFYSDLKKTVRRFKPDLILLHGGFAMLYYLRVWHREIKVIYVADTMRDGKNAARKSIYSILSKFYRMTSGIWCPGNAAENYFRRYVGSDVPIRQGCYTNDVDKILDNCKKFNRENERKELGFYEEDFVFLFVGKLISTRKIERLLSVASLCEKQNNNIKFLVVGNGPEEGKVSNYVKVHNNLRHISQVPIAELEKVYVCADAYIHLGWEPYSLALYEAAIVGIPIIANAKIGASYDCIINESNGYKYKIYDEQTIVNKIIETFNGKYAKGALEEAKFIKQQRGIEWACNQLVELIGD